MLVSWPLVDWMDLVVCSKSTLLVHLMHINTYPFPTPMYSRILYYLQSTLFFPSFYFYKIRHMEIHLFHINKPIKSIQLTKFLTNLIYLHNNSKNIHKARIKCCDKFILELL